MQLKTFSKALVLAFLSIFLLGTVFAVNFANAVGVDNEYDIKRLLVIGFVWFSSLMFCFVKDVDFIRFSRVTQFWGMTFLSLAVMSTFTSLHPFWSIVELANIGLLVVAFLLFSTSIRAFEVEFFHFGVYVSALLFSVFTLVKYLLFLLFSYLDMQNFDIHGLISGYVNVRFFNQLQVMVIPLFLLPFFKINLAKFRSVSLIIMSLHWMVLLQTEARGGVLSLILASSLISYFLCAVNRKRFIYTQLKIIFLGVFLWLIFIITIPYWLMGSADFQIRTNSSGRIDLWLYVLSSIQERFWLGFGPMSFTWAEGKPLPNAHPHNAVMQLLYEYGTVACFAVIFWSCNCIYRRLVFIRQSNNISNMPIILTLLTGLIYSLFSGVAVMPYAQLMFVFMFSVLMSCEERTFCEWNKWSRIILCLFVSLASSLMLITYKHESLLSALYPRVWLNGLISY